VLSGSFLLIVDLQMESVRQENFRGCMDKNIKITGNMLELFSAIPIVRLDRITREMTEDAEKRGH
jgi:hypothetical protein